MQSTKNDSIEGINWTSIDESFLKTEYENIEDCLNKSLQSKTFVLLPIVIWIQK